MRKPVFAYAKTKTQISFAVHVVQSLYFINPKCQASSHLLWQYSPVCVGPGRKPRRPLSHNEAHFICQPVTIQESTTWNVHEPCLGRKLINVIIPSSLVRTPAGAHFVVALGKSQLPCLVLVEPRKRCTDDRLGQTVTRLEITLCLMC